MKSTWILIALVLCLVPGLVRAQQTTDKDRPGKPITYGIVIDASKSIGSQFNDVIAAAKTIVNNNEPADETFLVRFVDSAHIDTLQDFTSDKTALLKALDKLFTDLGQSAIVDAVYVSAEALSKHANGGERRTALVVITDGDDRASYYKQDQLFARLREIKVRVFVVGIVNQLNNRAPLLAKSSRDKAAKFLQRLAAESGGRTFFLESSAELPGIANAIATQMRQ